MATEGSPLPLLERPVLALLVWRRVGFSHLKMPDIGMSLTEVTNGVGRVLL